MSGIALLWAVLFTVVATSLVLWRTKDTFATASTAGVSLVGGFFWYKVWIYLFTPAFVGTFGGYSSLIWASILFGVVVAGLNLVTGWLRTGFNSDFHEPNGASAGWSCAIAGVLLVVFCVGWFFTYTWNSWGTANVKEWGALADVTIEAQDAKLPKTNPDRIQMVTRGIAQYRGQAAITKGGQHLSSYYQVRESDWTKVSVKGRTYWVAPLVYASSWMEFTGNVEDSPGFISVDAENPNGEAKVHLGHTLKVLPSAMWMRNLERYVYYQGYTAGVLEDATLEVDDEWQPYFTMTYTVPKFVVGGQVMQKVIVVNGNTLEVKAHDPGKEPNWIERVMSDEIVSANSKYWGHYSHESIKWPNSIRNGGRNEQQPADMDFVFNEADQPVWSLPMTSTKSSDSSSTGLLLYSTKENKATFYPGVRGMAVGDTVKSAFENSPKNLKGYQVKQIQLYAINGQPTYVGIYVQDQGTKGESFAAIGFLHAMKANAANVIYAQNKRAALSQYLSWVATGGVNDADISSDAVASDPVEGVIYRINGSFQNNSEVFLFKIEGDERTFTVTRSIYFDLPLVQEGDKVRFNYVDTGQKAQTVNKFNDITLEQATGKPVEANPEE